MREETKEIIDEIIRQWGEGKLYTQTLINNDGNEVFTVVKDVKQVYEKVDNKTVPDLKKAAESRNNPNDVICRIVATRNVAENEAYIYFRGCYSIDGDYRGVYEYVKTFLGIIRAKARQMNAKGIKFKLNMIDTEKLGEISCSFKENKQSVLKELFGEEDHRCYNRELFIN